MPAKETWVEPREGAVETRNQSPCQRKVKITRIVNLACISVPPIHQDRISRTCLDGTGIRDCLPRELGECLASDESTTFLGAETVLLRVGGIPDPVHKEIGREKGDENVGWPGVRAWGMVGEVQCAVAIGEGHAGKVPEDEHEAPFLVVHVPIRFISSHLSQHHQRTYQVVVMHSSPFAQALAYKKWAITKKHTSGLTYP